MNHRARPEWKVSLHGGHCGDYCDHATGTLREMLDSAVAAGYRTFGVTEHAPRMADHLLYDEERAMGWDVPKLEALFDAYAIELGKLADEFDDHLTVLRGFECEVVPTANYREIMLGLRERYDFEYIVGSVHHVDEITIDGPPALFETAVEAQGGLEPFALSYYRLVGEMIEDLNPEVVGHFDLVRRNAPSDASVATPAIRRAAEEALETARDHDCILDLNTAGYRKGLGTPYPAPWMLKKAHSMGLGFCFGDDSHAPDQVGEGIEKGRAYLLENGISTVTVLEREAGRVVRHEVSLES